MQVEFTVRDYRPGDFLTLWTIDQSCFEPEIAYSQYELRRYIRWANSFTLVAESKIAAKSVPNVVEPDSSGIIGFVVVNRGKAAGHIITIDVRSETRGKRVGSALLNNAEDRLRSCGCRSVRLETAVDNATAIAFYKKHDYAVVNILPRYYSNGVDALMLEKDLHSPSPSDNLQK
jgi:ribosomal-protein-alanine N-acetyltransferase